MGINQNPITRYTFTGLDTVPVKSRAIQGKATWDGHVLTVTDYDQQEMMSLKRYDGLLIDGQLAIIDAPVRNASSTFITIPIMPARRFDTPFAEEDMKLTNGLGNTDYMWEWHILGGNYTIEGIPYSTAQNFKRKIGIQLVNAVSPVVVGAGHVTSTGNASGGGGGGGGQTPAGALHVIALSADGTDTATVASYATITVEIVGNEATFNGEDISNNLSQSGSWVYNDDRNSVTPITVTVGMNTFATITYRDLVP